MTKVDCLKAVLWRAVWICYLIFAVPVAVILVVLELKEHPLMDAVSEVDCEIAMEAIKLEKF